MFRAFVALLLVTAFPALSMAETNHVVSQSDLQTTASHSFTAAGAKYPEG